MIHECNTSSYEDKENICIPKNIFQTWHTKKLSPLMYKATQQIINANPEFNYSLYDDTDCREFIQKHFDRDVLFAYDSLIPGAYKADLWRYCILYKYGGVYLDIKYIPVNDFSFISLIQGEHLVIDIDEKSIYNALMICFPGNNMLFIAINKIVENVKNKFYGKCPLEPTGPKLLSRFISSICKTVDLKHVVVNKEKLILYSEINILKCYDAYLEDRDKYSKKKHYSILWKLKQIYI